MTCSRTATGNHRRYNEADVLHVATSKPSERQARHNGTPESNAEIDLKKVLNEFGPETAEDIAYGKKARRAQSVSDNPALRRNTDHNFTSWDKETNQARASVDVEQYRQKKQTLIEAPQEAKRKREEQQERAEQNKREADWLSKIKREGLNVAREEYLVPGPYYQRTQPPPSVISAIAQALDKNITLSTCPLPNGEWDLYGKWDAEKIAKTCAKEHVDAWLADEKRKVAKEKAKRNAPVLSSLSDELEQEDDGDEGEDGEEYGEYDDDGDLADDDDDLADDDPDDEEEEDDDLDDEEDDYLDEGEEEDDEPDQDDEEEEDEDNDDDYDEE